jgi:putative transposase
MRTNLDCLSFKCPSFLYDLRGKSLAIPLRRTISTWLYRFTISGVTGVQNNTRSDKGQTRKVSPEELLEAINQVLPFFRSKKRFNKSDIYRCCIEKGLLRSDQIAWTTFYRFIRTYELLKDDPGDSTLRLAFAMQYANQRWQADTMYGPYVNGPGDKPSQSRLIAFLDDASRVCCHGQFFLSENIDSMIAAIRSAFYKRGIPDQLYVDNGSIYSGAEIALICARVGTISICRREARPYEPSYSTGIHRHNPCSRKCLT